MSEIKRYMENVFKPKQDKITNSSQIKEILDTSKVPLKEESIIMDYIYELEDKLKRIDELEKYIIQEEIDNNKLLKSNITSQSGKDRIEIENYIYDDILDELRILRGEDNESN